MAGATCGAVRRSPAPGAAAAGTGLGLGPPSARSAAGRQGPVSALQRPPCAGQRRQATKISPQLALHPGSMYVQCQLFVSDVASLTSPHKVASSCAPGGVDCRSCADGYHAGTLVWCTLGSGMGFAVQLRRPSHCRVEALARRGASSCARRLVGSYSAGRSLWAEVCGQKSVGRSLWVDLCRPTWCRQSS